MQQNSQRDAILASLNLNIFARHADHVRMSNIAQMTNVLQTMILKDKERIVAMAAKDSAGNVWLELTNLDPRKAVEIEIKSAKAAKGETLTAPALDSVNTFDEPHSVAPKPIAAKLQGGKLILTLDPKSVTVVSVEP